MVGMIYGCGQLRCLRKKLWLTVKKYRGLSMLVNNDMKISEYIKEYTAGNRITFKNVASEIRELIVEVVRMNKEGVKEEFEDTLHFLQLWLYWRFGLDGEIWETTKNSVKKFMDRKLVWNRIYIFVGLAENISGYAGNYKKTEKVINHLQKFGVSREKAEEVYRKIMEEK